MPDYARIVYIDVRKVHWCSVGDVSFRSFVRPRIAREARSIMRTVFTSQCGWADVLVVRGRCFCSHKSCHAANRVLEELPWQWSKTKRPFVVYTDGSVELGGGDLVLNWLNEGQNYDRVCQCNLVAGRKHWHRPGKLYTNITDMKLAFEMDSTQLEPVGITYIWACKCLHVDVKIHFPHKSCTKRSMNGQIVAVLCRATIEVLQKTPPKVPPKYNLRENQPWKGKSLVVDKVAQWLISQQERQNKGIRLRLDCWYQESEMGIERFLDDKRTVRGVVNKLNTIASFKRRRLGAMDPRTAWKNRPKPRDIVDLGPVEIVGLA